MKTKSHIQTMKIIWLMVLVSLWEIVARSGLVTPLLMPSLVEVFKTLYKGIFQGHLLLQLFQSIGLIMLSVLISFVLSTIMVYLDYYYGIFRSLFELLASMLHPLPGIALLPLVILAFGIGAEAVFAIILHAVLWPMYLNTKLGFSTVDGELLEVAHNNGASKLQVFRYVLFPGSTKAILAGLQIGWSRGWRGLISAEMVFGAINAIGGIGWYIYERRAFMDTPGIYAGVLLVIIVGVLVEQLLFNTWIPYLYNKSLYAKDGH